MRVSVLVNHFRPDAVAAARDASSWLIERGVEVFAERDEAPALGVEPQSHDKLGRADLMVTFGGDGTLIEAAHLCAEHETPILGVHYGRFGFVTQCSPDQVYPVLENCLGGNCEIEERMMIETHLVRAGKTVASLHALNEMVVQRSATTRLLTFEVKVNGAIMSRYPADGVLVATPTGSTAYSLSAGGPIVDPSMRALLLVAVMPHTLNARPIVLPEDAHIEIKVETRGDAILSSDGQSRLHLLSGDMVTVTKSNRTARLITVKESDFLHKLSERLSWSQGPKHDDGPTTED